MMASQHSDTASPWEVISIGPEPVPGQMKEMLQNKLLSKQGGKRHLPTALLWGDATAHKIWHEILVAPELYSMPDEQLLIKYWAKDIAQHIPDGAVVIDLGCGEVTKVQPLLDELENSRKRVSYYALDISDQALRKTLENLPTSYRYVRCTGLWGTFDDVRVWCKSIKSPRWFLSLGSIFGNDQFDIAVNDLKKWSSIMRPQDRMLLGLDGCKSKERVWESYNGPSGKWHELVRNGLLLSNKVLGHEWYRPDDWLVTGRVTELPTHRWVVRAKRPVQCDALGLSILPGEEIVTNEWFKYGPEEMQRQFDAAGFCKLTQWKSPSGPTYEYLLARA